MFLKTYSPKAQTRRQKRHLYHATKINTRKYKIHAKHTPRNNYGRRCNLRNSGQTRFYIMQPNNDYLSSKSVVNNQIYSYKTGRVYNILVIPTKHHIVQPCTRILAQYTTLGLLKPKTLISHITLPGRKLATFVKAPGTFAKIIRQTHSRTIVQLPSKRLQLFKNTSTALLGPNANALWRTRNRGKAGHSRMCGRHPRVRLLAKNCNAKQAPTTRTQKKHLKKWRLNI